MLIQHETMPITCSTLLNLRDYWRTLRGRKTMPGRHDIDPVDIPTLLSKIALVDVFYHPLRFRYRLVGTSIVQLAERDATGDWLDEKLYGDKLERMLWSYKTCVQQQAPVAVREHVLFADKDWVVVEVIILPLGRGEGDVEIVLAGVDVVTEDVFIPKKGQRLVLNWQLG